jgi:hypothetical protein
MSEAITKAAPGRWRDIQTVIEQSRHIANR